MIKRHVTYLQQTGLSRGSALPPPEGKPIVARETMRVAEYRRLFGNLGLGVRAPGRLDLAPQALSDALTAETTRSYVMRMGGNPVGICETERAGWEEYELVTFGMLRSQPDRTALFYLVDQTVRAVWTIGKPRRVWLRLTDADPPDFSTYFERLGFGIFDRRDEDWPV